MSDLSDLNDRDLKRRRVDSSPSFSHQADIAAHYNSHIQKPLGERVNSTIIGLRNFNNWIKSVLIDQYCFPQSSILDICGGKGGDLQKYKVAKIGSYVLADHAHKSVENAVERFLDRRMNSPFPALFISADCHLSRLSAAYDRNQWFDCVSCQFALHYSFETETRARDFLFNVSERLKPGGHFIATFPNAEILVKKLRESQSLIAVKNNICTVRFDDPANNNNNNESIQKEKSFLNNSFFQSFSTNNNNSKEYFSPLSPFGLKYWFNLTDAIDDCPEYLVHLPTLINLCSLFGLICIYSRGLHSIFHDYVNDKKYFHLLKLMKVVDENNKFSSLTQDEWETLNLYQGIVFKKLLPTDFNNTDNVKPPLYTEPTTNINNNNNNSSLTRHVSIADIKQLKPETESFTAKILEQFIDEKTQQLEKN